MGGRGDLGLRGSARTASHRRRRMRWSSACRRFRRDPGGWRGSRVQRSRMSGCCRACRKSRSQSRRRRLQWERCSTRTGPFRGPGSSTRCRAAARRRGGPSGRGWRMRVARPPRVARNSREFLAEAQREDAKTQGMENNRTGGRADLTGHSCPWRLCVCPLRLCEKLLVLFSTSATPATRSNTPAGSDPCGPATRAARCLAGTSANASSC